MMGASAYRSRVTPTVALPARPEPNKRIEHPCARTPSRPTRSLRSLGPEGLFSETNGEGRTTWCAPGTLTVFRRSSRIRSNNYGPYHFPEKLILLTILNALE